MKYWLTLVFFFQVLLATAQETETAEFSIEVLNDKKGTPQVSVIA